MNNATTFSPTPISRVTAGFPRPTSVLHNRDLPGPLMLQRLAHLGTVCKLDDMSAYLAEHGNTLYGRGAIMASLSPRRTGICAASAAWVWLGGAFPNTIDILSSSHFRSLVFGRRIRVFNRNTPPTHMTTIGALHITTPIRTACDIALLDNEESANLHTNEMVCSLMESYGFKPMDCLRILSENRFWQNAPRAREFFGIIEHCF